MDAAAYRERLYDVFVDRTRDLESKIDRALRLGREYLELSLGFFTRIDEGTQLIVQSVGEHPLIQSGETCPLDEAYCRRTIELDSPLAVQNATTSSAISETALETFDLGTYIGGKVVVDDETYGTVCFADGSERGSSFTDVETHFVELLATLAGHAVQRESYESQLEAREARLDERAEIYRAVIDASFDLVFRIDTESRLTFVSEASSDLLGSAPEAYIGRPFTTVLPDEETIEQATELYEGVLAGRTVEEEYLPLQTDSGERVVVDLRATPIYRSSVPRDERTSADIVGVQATARDATERLRRERLVSVLNRVLRHNLRNDMNVIDGYAELLSDRLSGEEAEFAARIASTSDRLVTLAESARKLETHLASPPTLDAIDVVPIVERAAAQIDDRYAAASVTVETPEAAVVRAAPSLETAVWELLDNAAKHAGDRPNVSVEVRETATDVVIRVADDGPGLPAMERSVLASGEETPLTHGQGLGLWLVHWIVESLEGELDVRETGGGACIEIRLQPSDRSQPPATE